METTARVYTLMVQPLLQLGLESALRQFPQFMFCGAYQDVDALIEALVALDDRNTDILILDYQVSADSYRTLFAALRSHRPQVKILFFLGLPLEEPDVIRALRAGADGYLLHSVSEEGLERALEEVAGGRSYLQPHVTPIVLAELRKPLHAMKEWDKQADLTERERMLLQLAADGLTNTQIGDVLGLAEKTIRNLWSSLFVKLGINDRTQAVLWAIRSGHAELR